jgi:hypothetical protein
MNTGFSVGDKVSFTDHQEGRSHPCTVVRVMPVEHRTRTYRIRDDAERFERAVDESALSAVDQTTDESASDA